MEETELKNALVEVRKAYKLLHEYQRRVLDIALFVNTKIIDLTATTLSLNNKHYWWPWFSNSAIKKGHAILSNTHWAWDWLGLYMFEVGCDNQNKGSNHHIKFACLVITDTAYFKNIVSLNPQSITCHPNEDIFNGNNRNDIDKYFSGEGETKIVLMLGKDCWHDSKNEDNEQKLLPVSVFLNDKNVVYKLGDKIFTAKAYNLENFMSEESISNTCNDFLKLIENTSQK